MRAALSIVTVLVVGTTASSQPVVERLTGPQHTSDYWLTSGSHHFFGAVIPDGRVFALRHDRDASDLFTNIVFNVDGTAEPVATNAPAGFVIRTASEDGRWIGGAVQFQYGPDQCVPSSLIGGSTSRHLRYDAFRETFEFLTDLCPTFTSIAMSIDGGELLGTHLRGDWPHQYIDGDPVREFGDAAIWRDGAVELLDLPVFPTMAPEDFYSHARDISADERIIVGNALLNDREGPPPPFGEAILWRDGAPELLPHFQDDSADHQTSFVYSVSSDGSAMIGDTASFRQEPDESWLLERRTTWISRDGVLTEIPLPDQNHRVSWLTEGGALVVGNDFANGYDFSGIVWTDARGLERADVYLASLGVDLGGQPVRFIVDMTRDGRWMLAALGVDDDHEQFARIRIPCSPANLTADRAIALDDLSGDGLLDLADIVAFLTLYADGCSG